MHALTSRKRERLPRFGGELNRATRGRDVLKVMFRATQCGDPVNYCFLPGLWSLLRTIQKLFFTSISSSNLKREEFYWVTVSREEFVELKWVFRR